MSETGTSAAAEVRGDAEAVPARPDRWGEVQAFLTDLLRVQCAVAGAAGGIVFLKPSPARRGGIAARLVAREEEREDIEPALASPGIVRLAERTAASGQGQSERLPVVRAGPALYGQEEGVLAVGVPLVVEGRCEGASVVVFARAGGIDTGDVSARLALTVSRFEAFLWKQRAHAEAERAVMLRQTLELLDRSFEGPSAAATGTLICHEMKRRFGCTRVSIGLVRGGGRIRLAAVSGAEEIDRKSPAVEAIEAAMEECADQDAEIIYPPPEAFEADPGLRRVTRMHETLSARFGPSSILSLPLRLEGDLVGVVTLERPPEDPFPPGVVPLVRLVSEFIGPTLWLRRLADRGVLAVTRDRVVDLAQAVVGPRHTGKKVLAAVVLAALVVCSVPWVPDRISAPAEVRAQTVRSIVPPFEGYLSDVRVKPGDRVAVGDVLATMDTSEIEEEILSFQAQRRGAEVERNSALARSDLARVRQLEAEIEWYEAEILARERKIERAAIRSPLDGVVARGDIESLIRARVDPTQVLMEVVREDPVAVARVDERRIGKVRVGQGGHLVTRAWPGLRIPAQVRRINPSAEAIEGANVFRVEVGLEAPPSPLRLEPGLSGTVRLYPTRDDGTRARTSVLNMVLGPIVDEIRLRLWW